MKLPKYVFNVRELLDFSEAKMWSIQRPGVADLTFDDGVVIKNANTVDILISWYYWQLSAVYKSIRIDSGLFLNGRTLTDRVHRAMMMDAIRPTVGSDIDKEDIWRVAYRDIYNKLYNAIVDKLIAYVTTTDVPHILEILFDEEVRAINATVTINPHTIDRAYEVVAGVLQKKYPRNPIARANSYETVKLPQFLQSFSVRGLVTDIDSNIYQIPILRGFAMGFRTINDLCKESRSAAKSFLFNKDPVKDAEYLNRRLQLVCAALKRIVSNDCGTKVLHEMIVPEGAYGKTIISDLAGLYQRLPSGELRLIKKTDLHLRGTRIAFRTTLTCLHLPKQCVCSTCYGQTAYSVPWDSNPGHVSCTAINERITQLIISTKHLDFIQHNFKASLTLSERKWLEVNDKHFSNLYLKKTLQGKRVVLRIRKKEAEKLVTISYCSKIENVIPGTITSLSNVSFCIRDNNNIEYDTEFFDLVKEASQPSLSSEALSYMKDGAHGWESKGEFYNIEFGEDWNYNHPIFSYPHKHDSMAKFAIRFEQFIRSSSASKGKNDPLLSKQANARLPALNKYKDPTIALMDGYFLLSEKLNNVHIGHIATILATSRVQDASVGNYNMPAGLTTGSFASHDSIIAGRSGGAAVLFETQGAWFEILDSHLIKDRHGSVLDKMIYIPRADR